MKMLCKLPSIRAMLVVVIEREVISPMSKKLCRNILICKGHVYGGQKESFLLKTRGSQAGKLQALFTRDSYEEIPKVFRTIF